MIYIVIPVHNRLQLTRACLECLSKQTYRHFRIIVIDDGSTDGTSAMIEQEFSDVQVIRGDGNLWWAEATNVGIRYALQQHSSGPTDFVLTLNDDTEVGTNYLATLLSVYQRQEPCIVGSVCVDIENPDRLQYAGTRINLYWAGETSLAEQFENCYRKIETETDTVESDTLPGRGALIPFEVFDKIGLFDAYHFKQYMADIEFSVRARKAGYRLVVATRSPVYSHVGATGLQLKSNLSLKQFVQGLSSTRSPINLSLRYNFARLHSPVRLLYFIFDVGRILSGYCKRRFLTNT